MFDAIDLSSRICGQTGDDYWQVMADLLPIGAVWPRDPTSVMQRTIRGWAEEFARIHLRDCDLLNESYPCGARETLPDWERLTGLQPHPCIGNLPTIRLRQRAVCALLGMRGGASEQYFYDLARALGYDIEIRMVPHGLAFRASQNRAGDPLTNGQGVYIWQVVVHGGDSDEVWFRAGVSVAGEPLRLRVGDTLLKCLFEQLKPAHTMIQWLYPP